MVVLKSSKNKEAAHAFINYILDPEVHGWVAENILYKVPEQGGHGRAIDPALKAANAPLQMTPAELLEGESIVDLGEDVAEVHPARHRGLGEAVARSDSSTPARP